ncbi:response regulator transcription factor [Niabella beijingensis]|uniref:response regulator transcription factor n=1 Tax=Niabella beijingensis TaxID=2872700 RepID=UPI001CC14B94|nr:response regulator transcription factor [Niabella beijingensis]MBZ4192427.1 response regulator transcription factor [Niabella beijingensis]
MKVLVIEKDQQLAKSIYEYLGCENYRCEVACDISDSWHMIEDSNYDCILLDIDFPNGAGLTFLKQMRKQKKRVGVIIVSERNSLEDKITSLKLGADDYLTKPFHLAELSARIGAIIRRRYMDGDDAIVFKDLKLSALTRSATVGDQEVSLTRTEYKILLFLALNKDRIVSKEEIAEYLSGQSAIYLYNFDVLYTHIKNLKKKLQFMGKHIKAIYAMGYKLSE